MTQWLTVAANSGPYGVAVDPVAGFVYWTEYVTGNLRRSSTTTPGVTTILTGLGNPTYLTIDVAGARLYWSEGVAGNQHIKRATTAGGSVTTLPCPLTTYGGLVYQPSGQRRGAGSFDAGRARVPAAVGESRTGAVPDAVRPPA